MNHPQLAMRWMWEPPLPEQRVKSFKTGLSLKTMSSNATDIQALDSVVSWPKQWFQFSLKLLKSACTAIFEYYNAFPFNINCFWNHRKRKSTSGIFQTWLAHFLHELQNIFKFICLSAFSSYFMVVWSSLLPYLQCVLPHLINYTIYS